MICPNCGKGFCDFDEGACEIRDGDGCSFFVCSEECSKKFKKEYSRYYDASKVEVFVGDKKMHHDMGQKVNSVFKKRKVKDFYLLVKIDENGNGEILTASFILEGMKSTLPIGCPDKYSLDDLVNMARKIIKPTLKPFERIGIFKFTGHEEVGEI